MSHPEHLSQIQGHLQAVSCRLRERYLQDYMAAFNDRLPALLREGATPSEAGFRIAAEQDAFRREQAADMREAMLATEAELAREEQSA